MSKTRDILNSVDTLAPMPNTAVRLMRVVNDPHSSVENIIDAIRYDQSVTSALLKICNSAYAGLSRRITSINDALVYLGTAKVLQLVMSVHASSMYTCGQKGYGLQPGVLWRHSVAVALAASIFADRIGISDANPAFTAGLLHGIGKTVMNEYVADEFAEILRRVADERISFVEAERQVLGVSHEEIGAQIAERWKLPELIVRCIRYQYTPSELNPPDALVDAVHLAHCVCLILGVGLGEDGLCYRADAEVMKRHGLHEQDLEEVGLETITELDRIEHLFAESGHTIGSVKAAATQERIDVG